jgi:hypothetical protein
MPGLRPRRRIPYLVASLVCALAPAACSDGDDDAPERSQREQLQACVEAWNAPDNFRAGTPGRLVRSLDPRPAVPLFAHVSRDRRRRCVVFLDTPSTVDDRRFVRAAGRYSLACKGDCGQDVPPDARTFQFLRNGSLP